jgi:hypothetical protein
LNWQRRELGFPRLTYFEPDFHSSHQPNHVALPIMSYGKKDEDADSGLVKIDRTQVFQEGERRRSSTPLPMHAGNNSS